MAAERKFRIVEFVKRHKVASIAMLAKEFDVHEATIRRDLAEIEREGLVKRTHGGVTIDQWKHDEPSFDERSEHQYDQKSRIGREAARMVEDGDTIIIDSGTTTLHIAKNIKHLSNVTVVTNDMNVAAELRHIQSIKTILTGGELYLSSYMLNGIFTDQVLQSLHVQKAFIGIPAIHPQYGLMHPEAQLVSAKKWMIHAAEQIIVLADDSKIGKLSLHTVVPNTSIDTLITGKEADDKDIKRFREFGIDVRLV